MDTAIKYPLPGRVKPQFVIFDIHALWRSTLSVKGLAEDALYIYTHMATMGLKGLKIWAPVLVRRLAKTSSGDTAYMRAGSTCQHDMGRAV